MEHERTEIDEDVAEALDGVNWYSMSRQESRSLGISLGLHHDAQTEVVQSRDRYIRAWLVLGVVSVVCAYAILSHMPPIGMGLAITVALSISLAFERLHLRAARSLCESQKSMLMQEIAVFKRRQIVDKSEDEEDETTPVIDNMG